MLGIGLVMLYASLLLICLRRPEIATESSMCSAVSQRPPPARQLLTVLTDSTKGIIESRLGVRSERSVVTSHLWMPPASRSSLPIMLSFRSRRPEYRSARSFARRSRHGLTLFVSWPLRVSSRRFVLMTSRRRSRFEAQVPDTLQMLTGGMRAGHSLLRAVDAAAQGK